MLKEAEFHRFLQKTIYEIIECRDVRAATALHAYTSFLNRKPFRYDFIPLYLKIFETNNRYVVDALLSGHVPARFFDFVRVPNQFVMRRIFEIMTMYPKNVFYQQTLKVFLGLLKRVYRVATEGYRIYPINISDLNSFGKFLDEKKKQDFHLNRDILDILLFLTELDEDGDINPQKQALARHASRIRSDFFDQKRSLIQSMTEVILRSSDDEGPGISPEGVFID